MKKAISIVISLVMLLSFSACGAERGGETKDSQGTETQKNVINYDDLEYKSEKRFKLEEILTFTHSGGEYLVEPDSIFTMAGDSVGGVVPFGEPDYSETFAGLKAPNDFSLGESVDSLAKKFSFDTGYAAYVKRGEDFQMYDSEKKIDITDGNGGCFYFGYALDKMGNWAFMDYMTLTNLIRGRLIIQGSSGTYNVVVYSCIVDNDMNVTQITALYGDYSIIMQYTS